MTTRAILILPFLFITSVFAQNRLPGTVIVDASQFLHQLPPGYPTSAPRANDTQWMYNNLSLTLRRADECTAKVMIPEAGTYHLYVRSNGADGSSFKVSVGGKVDPTVFGKGEEPWATGGTFDLRAGEVEVKLTEISPGASFNVLVLSTKRDLLADDIKSAQYHPDAVLLKDYKFIPGIHAIRFGDVTGDGKPDMMVLMRNYTTYVYDNDGKELWHWDAPANYSVQRAEFEPPGVVWDFDRDGKAECIHWRQIDDQEWLVMADGVTGEIKHKVEWPTGPLPHVYNNFRTAVARLDPGYADDLVVFTDYGRTMTITAYGPDLKQRWQHVERRAKDHLGHYIYPIDLTGDGIDEVMLSHLLLDSAGKVMWSILDTEWPRNGDHVDSFRFADINGDGKLEAITGQSDIGVVIYDPLTGKQLWQHDAAHTQQVTWGNVIAGKPAPQIIANARYYGRNPDRNPFEPPGLSGQVHYFDPTGNLLMKWPNGSLNGNPDFGRGDWKGDGSHDVFWLKYHLGPDGRGTLYFAQEVYHMFDFLGNGAEQVICINRGLGVLQVYGYRNAPRRTVKREPEYLRNSMVNHTHY